MADWREEFARKLERTRTKGATSLVSIYQQAARELLGSLVLLGDGAVDAQRHGLILGQILPVLQRLNTRATMQLGTLLTDAYRKTKQEVFRLALLRGVEKPPEPSVGINFNRIPEERVAAMADASLEYVKAIDANLRAGIRQQLGIALVRGESIKDTARRIVGQGLTNDGINSTFHTAEVRADVIARTELARVQTATVQESMRQVAEVSPGWMMEWSAALERVCPICRALDGKQAPVGQTFDGFLPPRHPRCLPGDARVTAKGVSAASKRWYDGDLVVISTASGKHLSCTPNHPVLTPSGWVAAGLLHEGSDVISSGSSEWELLGDVEHQDVPPTIEEVAEAFGGSEHVAPVPVPLSPEDFHGDGKGSEVAVVWSDRLLGDGIDAAFSKQVIQFDLCWRHAQLLRLTGQRSGALGLEGDRLPLGGGVSGSNLASPFLGEHLAPLEPLGFALAPGGNTTLAEATLDSKPIDAELLSQGINRLTTEVLRGETVFVDLVPMGLRVDGDAALNEAASDDLVSDSELARKLMNGFAGPVFSDKVVDVKRVSFSGHVFNLETEEGYYIAEGILTHNCRCVLVPAPPHKELLRRGEHYQGLNSDLPPGDTDKVLHGGDRAGLSAFLKRHPVPGFDLKKDVVVGKEIALGHRDPNTGVLSITTKWYPDEIGHEFKAGLIEGVHSAAKTPLEASERTLVHELGHHLHNVGGKKVEALIQQAFAARNPITKYADINWKEYFSESHSAWVYHREDLRLHDPVGFKMVEDVRKMLGIGDD